MSDTKRIVRFHAKGMKVKDIAKRVGCSYHTAYKALWKSGLLKPKRKYVKRTPKVEKDAKPSVLSDAMVSIKADMECCEKRAKNLRKVLKALATIGQYV